MTANEMKYNLFLLYDKAFEYAAPSYDDRQASTFLTKAQNRIYKRRYMPNRNRFNEGFENSEQRRSELQQLIKNSVLSLSDTQTGVHPNGKFYDLPDDFLYAIEESLVTNVSSPDEIKVLPVTHNYYRANIKNPYKKPDAELAWRMDFSREDYGEDGGDAYTDRTPKRCEVIVPNSTTISTYRLRYLMQPPAIVCDELDPSNQRHCILDESLHDEIVDEAVKIAVAATTPEVYQISDKEQKENEF